MGFDVLYLPPIHPDRPRLPQGPEQHPDPGPERPGQPLGHRRARGGPQGHPPRARHARRLRPPGGQGAASWASRSRWTSPFSARPTIPTSRSIPSGSGTGPTARSSTPRTRPRSTRTSIRSTSSATTGRPSGPSFATSSSSGSATACRSSVSTTRTPSRSGSGTGSSRRSGTGIPTRSSSPRRSPGRRSCAGWPRGASRSRTPTSPGGTPSGS